jgi:Uma2 family endonuclease
MIDGLLIQNRVEIAERMTADDFWRDAPEGQKSELISGVMIVASPPLVSHERLRNFLLALLRGYVEDKDLGEVLGSRTAVELASDQVFEPDVLYVARDRQSIIQRKGIVGAPDFVIEVLSASTEAYDRGPKLREYERAGVREVWLIDPYGPVGTQFYRLENGRYVAFGPDADGILRSAAVSGLLIDVTWLWPREKFIPVRDALNEIARLARNL